MAVVSALFVSAALADGKHKTKICVVNKSGEKVKVHVYNGKDKTGCVGSPHKAYTVSSGTKKWVKCHGQGKGRCRISAHKAVNDLICYNKDNGGAKWPNCGCETYKRRKQLTFDRIKDSAPGTSHTGEIKVTSPSKGKSACD